ncbi:MAG: hypothetical protein IMZ44_23610 [Planctomycetes bacterium]|nr:hypothetical protein [Planctomycetota bacterium]
MARSPRNQKPERCFVCGKRHTGRCSPKALAAIDRANRRAMAAEDRPDDRPGEPEDEPTLGDRLALGFRWMHAIADPD